MNLEKKVQHFISLVKPLGEFEDKLEEYVDQDAISRYCDFIFGSCSQRFDEWSELFSEIQSHNQDSCVCDGYNFSLAFLALQNLR